VDSGNSECARYDDRPTRAANGCEAAADCGTGGGGEAGKITLQSLERAAEAMGCRVVYVLVPERPLTEVLTERAAGVADAQLASVDQTMRLEAQGVPGQQNEARADLIGQLLRKPSRLWDDP